MKIVAFLFGVIMTFVVITVLTFAYDGDVDRAIKDWMNFCATLMVIGAAVMLALMMMRRR